MGIGYACAERLVADGCSLVICSRDIGEIEEAARRLRADEVSVVGVQADVGRPEDCERLVARCVDEFGRVDVLVNNAGVYTPCPFLEFTADKWDETLNINLRGPVLVSAAAGRHMRDQGGGRIVHIASTNGLAAEPEFAHYNASKAALISLTKTMAVDLAQYNIVTNCVAPGWILTPLSEPFVGELSDEQLARVSPLGRVGRPAEIAEVVAFLCRGDSTYLLGETIAVDGAQIAKLAMP
jgi:NAD(P)-dependent dehydrogenase (short-subunit alcohol dehydrogenase family)